MTAIVRNEFRVFNVSTFINNFNITGNNLYLGIGRPEYWGVDSSPTSISDTAEIPFNNIVGTDRDWEDMMHLKLVSPSYMSNGVFKEMWAPNTVYDAYRHDWGSSGFTAGAGTVYTGASPKVQSPTDLSQSKFYVITSAYNIYVCLKNGTIGNVPQPSTQNPDNGTAVSGTMPGVYATSDGYLWKFIAVTNPANVVNFSTDTYHPVKTITTAPGVNDPYYIQYTNQLASATNTQGVYVINVVNGGSGYNSGLVGTIGLNSTNLLGNGSGIVGTMTVGAGGVITNITITNPGAGYTFLTFNNTGTGTGLIIDPIFTPAWGLGTDPCQDLCAFYCIINQTLNSNDGNVFTIGNDYRKISLITNPYNYGTTSIATTQFLDATTSIQLPGSGSLSSNAYIADAVVQDSVTLASGRVVDWSNVSGILRIIRTSNENVNIAGAPYNAAGGANFTGGSTLNVIYPTGGAGGTGGGVISSVTHPTVQPGSGHLIYTEYRPPVTRSLGQTENITMVLEF
jgi:hypothetical protein